MTWLINLAVREKVRKNNGKEFTKMMNRENHFNSASCRDEAFPRKMTTYYRIVSKCMDKFFALFYSDSMKTVFVYASLRQFERSPDQKMLCQ